MIEYTKEELKLLANKYLWGETEHEALLKKLFFHTFNNKEIMDHLDWVGSDELHYFQIPYDRVPLLINCDNSLGKLVAKWRLDICR